MASNQSQTWFVLQVEAVPAASEAIEHALIEMDVLGTEINHLRKGPSDSVTVSGFFDTDPNIEAAREQLSLILPVYDLDESAILSIESHVVEQTDWLAEWKKHWKPTTIGTFIVTPPWEAVDEPDKIVISIEPNMAFGTGTHATTQLCLLAIGENYERGEGFLDVGTGTGILVIGVAKMIGSIGTEANILACDTDTDSVKIAIENAALNGVGEQITFYEGSISDETPEFDFVCANLTIDVIVPILGQLVSRSKRVLLLSGILLTQQEMIADALRQFDIVDFEVAVSGEWISVLVYFK